jgi:hypothetical protein
MDINPGGINMHSGFVKTINSFDPKLYENISGDAKLGACSAYFLEINNVPLTLTYLGIAMYKMFPRRFHCDEEFPEFPSLDRLNREICMHMTITKKKSDSILMGSAKNGFRLTQYGRFVGKEILESIQNGKVVSNKIDAKKPIDAHKFSPRNEYNFLVESPLFEKFTTNKLNGINEIWGMYKVIPFTQKEMIREKLKYSKIIAIEENNKALINFVDYLLTQI